MVNLNLIVAGMAAHWTAMPCLTNSVIGLTVILFKVVETVRVKHVRTVEQGRLLGTHEWIEANRTVFVCTLHCLGFHALPILR